VSHLLNRDAVLASAGWPPRTSADEFKTVAPWAPDEPVVAEDTLLSRAIAGAAGLPKI
jgi:hypothetical protein